MKQTHYHKNWAMIRNVALKNSSMSEAGSSMDQISRKIPRPRGRAPNGQVWDSHIGAWVPATTPTSSASVIYNW